MKNKFLIISLFLFFLLLQANAQQNVRPPYQYPTEPEVLVNLREWQDLKFGLFMHWGTYSLWGIDASWPLCPEEHAWIARPKDKAYTQFVEEYENLIKIFNPLQFDPSKWAAAAKEAGMKYVIFTTKHHDGFNMFDTRQSEYRITSKDCPFHSHPKANVTKEIFEAFQKENFKTGAYYSIADWNHNDYWWDYYPPKSREMNYSPIKNPEKYDRFHQFMCNQLEELVNGDYGKVDILWFDLPELSSEKGVDWERLSKTVRSYQPQTMMVARHTNTQYENYRTPEQEIPERALDYPWETCMTMGRLWLYNADDQFKTSHQLIQNLVQIVSRGGNFLLNIGPSPDGDFHPTAYERLKEIGGWMKINSEAIYATKPISPYHETKLVFTQKGNTVYATYLPDEDEKNIPSIVLVHSMQPKKGSKVYLLGYSQPLSWENTGKGFTIAIPKSLQNKPPCQYAWTFKFEVNQ